MGSMTYQEHTAYAVDGRGPVDDGDVLVVVVVDGAQQQQAGALVGYGNHGGQHASRRGGR